MNAVAVTAFALTHPGKQRDHNEDAFHCDAQAGLFIVADGMGGLSRGDLASRVVIDSTVAAVASGGSVEDGFRAAHRDIAGIARRDDHERIGATAVGMQLGVREPAVYWIGDSRAYLWRSQQLCQLTRDHSFVQQLVDAGVIEQVEARTHPNRNVVTRAIGPSPESDIEPERAALHLRPGDRLLLCTDGLYGALGEAGLDEALREGGSDEAVAQRLLQWTLERSRADDNLTLICISVPAAR